MYVCMYELSFLLISGSSRVTLQAKLAAPLLVVVMSLLLPVLVEKRTWARTIGTWVRVKMKRTNRLRTWRRLLDGGDHHVPHPLPYIHGKR